MHELRSANPDEAREAIQAVLRDRRAITAFATAARDRRAFAASWASYMSGFRKMLCGYGPVTASLSLLDGLRIVDFLAGTTIVEYNTGHFDEAHHLDAFVEQVLAYPLPARYVSCPPRRATIDSVEADSRFATLVQAEPDSTSTNCALRRELPPS
ncbi:hypothetical protein [Micromonospora arida]|uniref:hypothetical protein n=1 Tax=Micromonospora arida TaxID=2203715 RepID=UPI003CECAB5A